MPRPVHVVEGKTGTHLIPHYERREGPNPALGTAAMAAVVVAALLFGGASGVVLSPDLRTPAPSDDWYAVIEYQVNLQMEDHLLLNHAADHSHEVTPSPPPTLASPTPPTDPQSTTPTALATPIARPTAGLGPRRTPTPTARPSTSTARPAPTAVPSPTCFRPGKPQGNGVDPCAWPPDG